MRKLRIVSCILALLIMGSVSGLTVRAEESKSITVKGYYTSIEDKYGYHYDTDKTDRTYTVSGITGHISVITFWGGSRDSSEYERLYAQVGMYAISDAKFDGSTYDSTYGFYYRLLESHSQGGIGYVEVFNVTGVNTVDLSPIANNEAENIAARFPQWVHDNLDLSKDNLDEGEFGSELDDDTEYDYSLYLKNVTLRKPLFDTYYSVRWDGTSLDDVLVDVPDSDTLIVRSLLEIDKDTLYYKAIPFFKDDISFSIHRTQVNMEEFLSYQEEKEKEGKFLTFELDLTPCYKKDGKLFIGKTTSVNLSTGQITESYEDEDGNLHEDDVTPEGSDDNSGGKDSFSFADISDYTSKFFSFLKSLIASMGSLPTLFATVFSFMPSIYVNAIGVIFVIILILRVLGR